MTLFDPALLPFTLALCGVAGIALLEALSALLGAPLSGALDEMAPDLDIDLDADLDGAEGAFEGGPVAQLLAWLGFGRVPLLVLAILLLTGFGAGGIAVQALAREATGAALPAAIAAGPALLAGVFSMHWLGGLVGRLVPKDETAAIARADLVGEHGVVTGGTARPGLPAQVRVTDAHGTTHYLLGEPEGDPIPSGARVRIASITGARARIVADESA